MRWQNDAHASASFLLLFLWCARRRRECWCRAAVPLPPRLPFFLLVPARHSRACVCPRPNDTRVRQRMSAHEETANKLMHPDAKGKRSSDKKPAASQPHKKKQKEAAPASNEPTKRGGMLEAESSGDEDPFAMMKLANPAMHATAKTQTSAPMDASVQIPEGRELARPLGITNTVTAKIIGASVKLNDKNLPTSIKANVKNKLTGQRYKQKQKHHHGKPNDTNLCIYTYRNK